MLRYAILVLFSVFLTGQISNYAKRLFSKVGNSSEIHTAPDSLITEPDTVPVLFRDFDIDPAMLEIDFCGDPLPLNEPHVARRYHNAVKHFSHPAYKESILLAQADLKVIKRILKQHHLPTDLTYIPLVESNFNSFAVSPKGAVGYWQLMPQTALALGLRVDDEVDERTDLIKSTHAAAKYLKWLYGELGDWTLAAAAYNSGPGKLIRQMEAQKKNNFYHLRLNNETSRYVYKIVAVKEMMNMPTRLQTWANEDFFASLTEYHRSLNRQPVSEMVLANPSVAQSTKK